VSEPGAEGRRYVAGRRPHSGRWGVHDVHLDEWLHELDGQSCDTEEHAQSAATHLNRWPRRENQRIGLQGHPELAAGARTHSAAEAGCGCLILLAVAAAVVWGVLALLGVGRAGDSNDGDLDQYCESLRDQANAVPDDPDGDAEFLEKTARAVEECGEYYLEQND
jgi:hypothetical protein